jgi:hypothetical protein
MAETSILTEILNRRVSLYAYFKVEACLQKIDSRFEIVFAKVTAQERNQAQSIKSPLDFGEYVYVSQCFELNDFPPILQEQNPTFKLGPYEFVLQNATLRSSSMGRVSSNNSFSEWPTELLELRPGSHQNYLNPKALVAHNASRIFHDQYDGIRQYMGMNISFNYNNGWIGAMLFILPDYRIRIREIVGDQHELTVKTEKADSLMGTRLHCLVDGAEGRQEILRAIDCAEITLQLTSQVDQLETIRIFITHPTDGLIDSYEQVPTYHSGRTRWLAGARRDDRKDTIEEIGKGEGPNLEFKPFIRIGKGEKKEAEVIRAAIAFANAGGGTILFGVNNLGEIEGIEKELPAFAPALEPVAAAKQYGLQLRTILNDATNCRLELQSTVIEIANHVLLRLYVAELPARDKPVWKIGTNDIWIRSGSTNSRPDPVTIRDIFRTESSFPGIIGDREE